MTRLTRIAPLAVLALGVAACDDPLATAPGAEPPAEETASFSEAITLPELQESASSAAVRVEVKLQSEAAPLVAREIERADADDVEKREKVEGRVTAADAQGITLALGGLRIGFDAGTRFRSESGDSLSQEEFLTLLQTALAEGGEPAVEAEREPPAEPQAPNDAAFVASELEIDDEASEPKLELNIDADNLQVDAATPTQAVLTVLGLAIEIRPSETEVEAQRPVGQRAKFEGIVETADAAAGTVTLRDGRVIRLVAGTEIETKKDKLASIAEVAAAVAAGQIVEAEGKGILEDASTLVAVEVEFEVEEEADDVPDTDKLKDMVASVDTVAGTFTLSGGQVVRLVAGTRIKGKELATLEQVALALADSQAVRADAKLLLEEAGPPARYIALEVKFKTPDDGSDDSDDSDDDEADDAEVEFEDGVASVDVAAGSFTLADGRTVRLAADARIEGDLTSLQAVEEALAAGTAVVAEGEGTLETVEGSEVLVAQEVKFEAEDQDEGEDEDDADDDGVEFEDAVASVDVAGGSFTLADGRVVFLTGDTKVEGDLLTLQAVADALLAGRAVVAEGEAVLQTEGEASVLVATEVKFEVEED